MKNVSLLRKSDKNDRFDYGMIMTKRQKYWYFNLSCKDYEVEYAIILLIQADSVLKYKHKNKLNEALKLGVKKSWFTRKKTVNQLNSHVGNKELLDKCERSNKIAPFWHKCQEKQGMHAKGI